MEPGDSVLLSHILKLLGPTSNITVNVGGDWLNPGIKLLPLPNANSLLGYKSVIRLVFRVLSLEGINHKFSNSMKIGKGNGSTTTLLFSLKRLDIVHVERRALVNTIVMENFNNILFHKSGAASMQNTYQSINPIFFFRS